MINVKNIEVFNLDGALRGMRNPMNSWDNSDSFYCKNKVCAVDACMHPTRTCKYFNESKFEKYVNNESIEEYIYCSYPYDKECAYKIGENDMKLAQRLIKAGTDHSKFMRQIFVSMDITAPLFFWKEASTYKIATTANSTSTMHKLAITPITKECFSFDNLEEEIDVYPVTHGDDVSVCFIDYVEDVIIACEKIRLKYLETNDKKYWRMLIQLLPESWNQTRTWTANYAVLRNIYFARKNHKLQEWQDFCHVIEELPYAKELICYE